MPDKPEFFTVVLNTDDMFIPQAWDVECEGALCGAMDAECTLALFSSKKAARTAIDVSAKWNALLRAQGKPYNDDFITYRRKLTVVPTSMRCKTK